MLTATALFLSLGISIEYIGIFAGIDTLVGIARTTVNVSSSMTSDLLQNLKISWI